MEQEGTRVPGIGVRHELVTEAGDRLGVLVNDGGGLELVVYDSGDPDACRLVLQLSDAEARQLRDLLGSRPGTV
jgi:TrkA domain protein